MKKVDMLCFWCREVKGEAEVEDGFGDGPAFADYIPCDHCAMKMVKGITLVAVDEEPQFEGQDPFGTARYPIGSWAVIDESWVKDVFEDGEFKDHVLEKRIMLMDKEELEDLLLSARERTSPVS
jgi:hypothetical protein